MFPLRKLFSLGCGLVLISRPVWGWGWGGQSSRAPLNIRVKWQTEKRTRRSGVQSACKLILLPWWWVKGKLNYDSCTAEHLQSETVSGSFFFFFLHRMQVLLLCFFFPPKLFKFQFKTGTTRGAYSTLAKCVRKIFGIKAWFRIKNASHNHIARKNPSRERPFGEKFNSEQGGMFCVSHYSAPLLFPSCLDCWGKNSLAAWLCTMLLSIIF